MGTTIEIDERMLDAVEDVAVFCNTWESMFHKGWQSEVETLDDFWRWCVRAVYGNAVTERPDAHSPERGLAVIDEQVAISFVFSQIDYRGEDEDDDDS